MINNKATVSDDLMPLISGIGSPDDDYFVRATQGLNDVASIGWNAALPEIYHGHKVFDVDYSRSGRQLHKLTETGQATIIRQAANVNDTEALFKVLSVLTLRRQQADLAILVGQLMFANPDGESHSTMMAVGSMDVVSLGNGAGMNRWQEEAEYNEAIFQNVKEGYYYKVTLAGPRREYLLRVTSGRNRSQPEIIGLFKFKSIADRDGNVVCAQDMSRLATPTPEGARNTPIKMGTYDVQFGNRFYRPVDDTSIRMFNRAWEHAFGVEQETELKGTDGTDDSDDSASDGEADEAW